MLLSTRLDCHAIPGVGSGRHPLTKGRLMIRVVVDSIRVSLLTQHRVVVLRETDSKRYLPIWIGPFEADAIAMAIQGHEPQRPMTHDLLKAMIGELEGQISHIFVSDIQDNTFYARIVIEQGGRTVEVDARPSDAIALAVRTEVPIFVEPRVLDQAGVFFDEEEQPGALEPPGDERLSETEPEPEPELNDESMSIFRNFINTLDLDDPQKGGSEKS
jgi:bifunctional DNase/RNase